LGEFKKETVCKRAWNDKGKCSMDFSVLYFIHQNIWKNSMKILNRVLKEQRLGKDFFRKLNYPFKFKRPMVWPLTPLHYRCTTTHLRCPCHFLIEWGCLNFVAEAACGWRGASVDPQLLLEDALWSQKKDSSSEHKRGWCDSAWILAWLLFSSSLSFCQTRNCTPSWSKQHRKGQLVRWTYFLWVVHHTHSKHVQ